MTHSFESSSPASAQPAITPGVLFRALLVDSEPATRSELSEFIKLHADFEVAATCASLGEAAAQIPVLAPELIIGEWSVLGGISLWRSLPAPPRALIVTSRESHHAVKAFEIDAIDYLLKPIAFERLAIAIARARVHLRASRLSGGGPVAAAAGPTRRLPTERLVLKSAGEFHFVPVHEVVRLEAQGDYVKVFTRAGAHLVRATISRLGGQLDPHRFLRVHRSHIVNRDYVTKATLRPEGDYTLTLGANGMVPVARAQSEVVRRLLD